MRIVTARISTTKGLVTLHMEMIKPDPTASLTAGPTVQIGRFKIPRARMLDQYARVEQRIAAIHAKIDINDRASQRFLVKRMDFTLSGSAVQTLQAIYGLASCFKLDDSDIILIDDQANLAIYIPEITTIKSSLDSKRVKYEFNLPITLNEYIQNKTQAQACNFNQDLVTKILNNPENKHYEFLSAFYLLNPENKEQTTILKNLSLFFTKPKNESTRNEFMEILNGFAREQFIQFCIGKTAEDGDPYNHQYTEIRAFDDSQFTLTENRRIQIHPLDSWGYKTYYAKGKQNFGKLKDEWLYMGKILGIEFAEDSVWDERIILNKESSEFFINKGLLYDEKFMKKLDLEKIMLFRNGFFYDNAATSRQMNSDMINKITEDFMQITHCGLG